ncbi:heme exporter protein CcmB [Acetobacter peroxydans]|jgi:heme exporter protein B|uniref:heme exporter protein CcmB n=1 Tax=Acetobacter peroxydans TaxID=104098 RepID=UPI0023577DBB|nr:heme exporter protein CcmB [Acetobacter peroxydans]MCH4143265.1 heme exporter protein CcmB [Acetobacter peroxydans]MCI1394323.1 heme exporter protein CcmB [Acetobacter peroxydans]MCI1411732.1 heme exporter protein CcmB [Acetobacter peroxydans]MCI1439338.1 heme exporter protein CcmB [Acetobacter peroxydans]MCI1567050.1 heme exporter protein CcmB [Acetobacter peroxydans]
MTSLFWHIVLRDLRLALRHGADTLGAVLFFIVTATLFPLSLGPSPELLRRMAPGIIWVCALLASLLPLDRLFGAELEDGSLDQLMLLGLPPSLVALAKMTAHWLTTGLPLLLAAGPLAIMLGLPGTALPVLLGGLLLGSLVLSLIGGMGASIVLGARRGGVLLPLLTLPLITPALIFGAAAIDAAATSLPWKPDLELLGAFVAAALPLCPLAAGAGLRAATE